MSGRHQRREFAAAASAKDGARRSLLAWLGSAAAVAILALPSPARAQAADWPAKVVRIVVPSPPGSATDLLARMLAEYLGPRLGQAFVVDNRPGGATNIGHEYVVRQPADGYTLLLTQNTLVSNISFFKSLAFDPLKDLTPISLLATTPLALVVNTDSKINSLNEFVAAARNRRVSYGSAGIGSPHHLFMVMLGDAAGVKMVHVPYKGSAPVAVAVVGKEVDSGMSAVGTVKPYMDSGRLRALGITDSVRSSLLPDVPSVSEIFPGVSINIWLGLLAPAKTPQAILDRLGTEARAFLKQEGVRERLAAAGIEPAGTTAEQFAQEMQSDAAKYRNLVKAANITPQ